MSSKRGRHAADLKKRKKIRQRFRGLVRSVIFNRIWLNDVGDQKLSLNVKKNIAMLVRTQRKIGVLTLAEKTLILTHPGNRSVEDRKKLVTLMASLTCFSRFPPKVRARLVSVVKFLYVEAGRKLVREGDIPMTIYFILTGEVEVSSRVFDPLKNDYYEKVEFIHGPGDCLGEVELIEDIPRMNTYTITSDAELLVVFDDDFDAVLRPVMAKQWMEKKIAIKTLDYFSFFNDEQVISACKLGMLKQFEPLESIYYEDKGQVSYVYFVISGECMILQCLKMKVTEVQGKKSFELVDISKDDSSAMFQDAAGKKVMQNLNDDNVSQFKDAYDIDHEIASIESNKDNKTTVMQKLDIRSIEISCGLRRASYSTLATDKEEVPDEYDTEEVGDENAVGVRTSVTENIEVKRTFASVTEEVMKQLHKLDDIKNLKSMGPMPISDNIKKPEENTDNIVVEDTKDTRQRSSSMHADENQQGEANTEKINTVEPKRTKQTSSITHGEERQKPEEHTNNMHPSITVSDHQRDENNIKKSRHEEAMRPKHATSLTHEEESHRGEEDSHKTRISNRDFKNEEIDYDADTGNIEYTQYSEYEEEASLQTKDYESMSTGRSWLKHETKKFRGKVENHFIDVGSLTYGGIFGLGEKIEHRVIMARTTVQCLLLPRFWLFERDQNPGNIWQRRRFYLDSTIPSRQTLFKDFLATRKWQQFKKDLIQSNLDPISTNNSTKVQDIPIICRIVESHAD